MDRTRRLTAIIEREEGAYVSLCPELDIASQGDTIEEARANLIEALTLFFETASPEELALHRTLQRGTFASIIRQSGLPKTLFEH